MTIGFHFAFADALFQSTLPLREVTLTREEAEAALKISIHTSPEGSDASAGILLFAVNISIHTSPEGSDVGDEEVTDLFGISIHTSPEGSDN